VNKILSYLLTAILSVGFTLIGEGAVTATKPGVASADQVTNAAFRDGRYQAKLDFENGRRPHLSIGRWSAAADRASYVAGYRQAYPQFLSLNLGSEAGVEPGKLTSIQESSDSIHNEVSLAQFQLGKEAPYRTPAGCLTAANP